MSHNKIKKIFNKSVSTIASDISKYALNPTKNFTREKKLPVDKLITFLVSQGASSTKNELLDFFSMSNDTPTASALNQQRDKLRPEALEAVFNEFNASVATFQTYSNYRFLAADGSTFSFFSKPSFASEEYYVSEGHSAKGYYSIIVRSHSKKITIKEDYYKRFIGKDLAFDFIDYGSLNIYNLSFRVVRFPLSDNTYECIVTNLPTNEFSTEEIKKLYFSRWGIETSFRKLKYTIGLCNFHSYKPEFIQQEVWAKLIAYNITETLINLAIIKKRNTKYPYKVNFSRATHICRIFLQQHLKKDSIDVMFLLQKELIPIRNERQYPRLQTAHFRRPRYFIYRAS